MSFAAPLFLIAVLAGVIPVILHMISRQKAPVLPFSTLRFLHNSVQRTKRRKRIHDLLLLLLRIAALVLVAVALARPTIRHLGGLLGRKSARAVVLILDNSAVWPRSMRRGRGGIERSARPNNYSINCRAAIPSVCWLPVDQRDRT